MTVNVESVLAYASSQVGYSRWNDPNEGTVYGRWYGNTRGHGAYYAASGVPYCAMFASWCCAGPDGTSAIPGGDFAYVPYGIEAARREDRLVQFSLAAPGDLICFDWDGDGIADHVGIVEANYGAWVQTIEGNTSPGAAGSQGNGGGVYRRTRSWEAVCAVIRPYYDNATSVDSSTGYAVVTGIQKAVGASADNVVGPDTTKRIYATVSASPWGGRQYPFGVEYAQEVVGATPDGVWGPLSDEAHDRVVEALQRAVGVTVDGIYGPNTNAAINSLLAAAEKP